MASSSTSQKNYSIVNTFELLKNNKIEFTFNWDFHKITIFFQMKRKKKEKQKHIPGTK